MQLMGFGRLVFTDRGDGWRSIAKSNNKCGVRANCAWGGTGSVTDKEVATGVISSYPNLTDEWPRCKRKKGPRWGLLAGILLSRRIKSKRRDKGPKGWKHGLWGDIRAADAHRWAPKYAMRRSRSSSGAGAP